MKNTVEGMRNVIISISVNSKNILEKVAREYPTTIIYLKDGTEKFCGYVTWNERLQEIHLRSNYHKDYEVVHYEDIASICVR